MIVGGNATATPDYLQYCGQPGTLEPHFRFPGTTWDARICIGREQWLPWVALVLLAFVCLIILGRRTKR